MKPRQREAGLLINLVWDSFERSQNLIGFANHQCKSIIADIEVNNDMYCLQNWMEKFPLFPWFAHNLQEN